MQHDFNVEVLKNTRCRLQRHADLKFFSGWIRGIDDKSMKVELNEDVKAVVGDRFYVEASGEEAIVCLTGDTVGVHKSNVDLALEGLQICSRPGQLPRYQADGIEVMLYGLESRVEAEAVDISSNGIGLLCFSQVPRFVPVKMVVRSSVACVECDGRIRYCRRDATEKGCFRVGVQLEPMEPAEERMWNRLVTAASELKAVA